MRHERINPGAEYFGAEGGLVCPCKQLAGVRHSVWRTNLCLLCFESCPPSADLYFGYLNLFRISSFVFRILLPPVPRPLTPIVVPPDSLQNLLKTCSFLSISVQFLLKTDKKVQKSANFCSFLPSFLAQKRISPIKSHFLLPPATPFFKKTLKKPYFRLFSDFFYLFSSPFSFCLLTFTLLIPAVTAGRLVLSFGGKDSGK
jgi:hypothetical protein